MTVEIWTIVLLEARKVCVKYFIYFPILAPQTRRWRVIFIGGEKKQATGIVDEQDGFPRWDCEVLM